MERVNSRYGYIYQITNRVNGKTYVGKKIGSEFDQDCWGTGKRIRRALSEFGTRSFDRKVLEWCSTEDILRARERYWINQLQSGNPEMGYNNPTTGNGGEPATVHLSQPNSKIIGFQIPGELIGCLEREARESCMTISALLRDILVKRYRKIAKFNSGEEGK